MSTRIVKYAIRVEVLSCSNGGTAYSGSFMLHEGTMSTSKVLSHFKVTVRANDVRLAGGINGHVRGPRQDPCVLAIVSNDLKDVSAWNSANGMLQLGLAAPNDDEDLGDVDNLEPRRHSLSDSVLPAHTQSDPINTRFEAFNRNRDMKRDEGAMSGYVSNASSLFCHEAEHADVRAHANGISQEFNKTSERWQNGGCRTIAQGGGAWSSI